MALEKGDVPVTIVTPVPPTPSLRRSQELARPRRQRKNLPLDKAYKVINDQTPLVKGLTILVLTGLPFIIFIIITLIALKGQRISSTTNATFTQLAKWLLISWGSFMGLLGIGRVLAAFAEWLCQQSRAWQGYGRLGSAICLRIVVLFWAIICWAVVPSVFYQIDFNEKNVAQNWVSQLQQAFKFLMIAFAIILAQGVVLELISTQYIQGWLGPRSQRASDELEIIQDIKHLTKVHIASDNIGIVAKLLKKLFVPIDTSDPYYIISNGRGDEALWTDYANKLFDGIARGKNALTRGDIDQQLRDMHRDPAIGHDLFDQLDDSCDGEVTREEVEKLVQRVGLQLNRRAEAQRGIARLLYKLETILSVVMLGIIIFIYVQFFAQKATTEKLGTLWTGIVALSFAFNGAVLEFTNSCVFVFGKHPYDVGDYIEGKGKKLIVSKIFLTHTNFEEVTNPDERGVVVQISHAALAAEPIINWTRTKEAVIEARSEAASKASDKTKKEHEEDRELVLAQTKQLKMAEPATSDEAQPEGSIP